MLVRPNIQEADLRAFLEAARDAAAWPWRRSEAVRSSLVGFLDYQLDPVGLALRLDASLRVTQDGELFEAMVDLRQALDHLLKRARLPIGLDDLVARLREEGANSLPGRRHELRRMLRRSVARTNNWLVQYQKCSVRAGAWLG